MTPKIIAGATATLMGIGALAMTANAQESRGFSGRQVQIENFIGRVEIRTGGPDIRVEIRNPGDAAEDPVASATSGGVVIDGGQRVRNLNCRTNNGEMRIGRWMNSRPIEDYPLLVITAPAGLDLAMGDSAFVGESGDLGSIDLSMNSCGRFEAGAIARDAELNINGSGDVITRDIGGNSRFRINGSGDISVGDIAGNVTISVNGSGDVDGGDVAGATEIDINGSGDIELAGIASLDVGVSGSGDVRVDNIDGAFRASIAGSGDIRIAGGRAQPFEAYINGSGDISFGGTAIDVTIRESGGGDVDIEAVEGAIDWRRNGRSVLRVGGAD
ncbi:DUF2807 domain-containing protein [Maricaulis sp.]|uniref:GIN domain-containing protein n=1 Tax=Maricaulis sp. TaxID=1486257 RepID=UPI002609C699|nr:DUF2807 domain-containing protein [Maricaulis sp.]